MPLSFSFGTFIGGVVCALLLGAPSPHSSAFTAFKWVTTLDEEPAADPVLHYFDVRGRAEAIRLSRAQVAAVVVLAERGVGARPHEHRLERSPTKNDAAIQEGRKLREHDRNEGRALPYKQWRAERHQSHCECRTAALGDRHPRPGPNQIPNCRADPKNPWLVALAHLIGLARTCWLIML